MEADGNPGQLWDCCLAQGAHSCPPSSVPFQLESSLSCVLFPDPLSKSIWLT